MQPLRTPNLDLSFFDAVASMEVTGKMTTDTLSESFEWFDELGATQDDFALCVEMRQESFEDLSEAAGGFRQVADVLRRVPQVDKCVVLTDSAWLRSTAKIESAVIPGLKIMAFDPSEKTNALKWLRDEPLIEAAPKVETKTKHVVAAAPRSSGVAARAQSLKAKGWGALDLSKVEH